VQSIGVHSAQNADEKESVVLKGVIDGRPQGVKVALLLERLYIPEATVEYGHRQRIIGYPWGSWRAIYCELSSPCLVDGTTACTTVGL
jgi:hypothetical protein